MKMKLIKRCLWWAFWLGFGWDFSRQYARHLRHDCYAVNWFAGQGRDLPDAGEIHSVIYEQLKFEGKL